MDISDVCANPGTICAFVASSGNHGMFSLQVWVDVMVSPSGRLMTSGVRAGFISNTGAPGTTKCPVAPASAIAIFAAIFILAVLNIVSGIGSSSNVAFVTFVSNAAFVGFAGAGLLKDVGSGWRSNDESFVRSAEASSLHDVLLMIIVLSSSSSSKLS